MYFHHKTVRIFCTSVTTFLCNICLSVWNIQNTDIVAIIYVALCSTNVFSSTYNNQPSRSPAAAAPFHYEFFFSPRNLLCVRYTYTYTWAFSADTAGPSMAGGRLPNARGVCVWAQVSPGGFYYYIVFFSTRLETPTYTHTRARRSRIINKIMYYVTMHKSCMLADIAVWIIPYVSFLSRRPKCTCCVRENIILLWYNIVCHDATVTASGVSRLLEFVAVVRCV